METILCPHSARKQIPSPALLLSISSGTTRPGSFTREPRKPWSLSYSCESREPGRQYCPCVDIASGPHSPSNNPDSLIAQQCLRPLPTTKPFLWLCLKIETSQQHRLVGKHSLKCHLSRCDCRAHFVPLSYSESNQWYHPAREHSLKLYLT